jgi:hypothetical protein
MSSLLYPRIQKLQTETRNYIRVVQEKLTKGGISPEDAINGLEILKGQLQLDEQLTAHLAYEEITSLYARHSGSITRKDLHSQLLIGLISQNIRRHVESQLPVNLQNQPPLMCQCGNICNVYFNREQSDSCKVTIDPLLATCSCSNIYPRCLQCTITKFAQDAVASKADYNSQIKCVGTCSVCSGAICPYSFSLINYQYTQPTNLDTLSDDLSNLNMFFGNVDQIIILTFTR